MLLPVGGLGRCVCIAASPGATAADRDSAARTGLSRCLGGSRHTPAALPGGGEQEVAWGLWGTALRDSDCFSSHSARRARHVRSHCSSQVLQ